MAMVSFLLGKSKSIIKKGASYAYTESKQLLATKTDIGRRLAAGIHSAKESVRTSITKLEKAGGDIIDRYTQTASSQGDRIVSELSKDEEFVKICERYSEKTGIGRLTPEGKTNEEFLQELIEASGVGPTKFAQIKSNDVEFMQKKITSPELRTAISKTKSDCSFSRTVEEAQEFIDKSFPGKNIKIKKELSAGSIGAAYLVEKPDGSVAIVKMLKKGVDKEQLELEEKIIQRLIGELEDTPEAAEKTQKMMSNLYHDWAEELDFTTELRNNKLLAKGAKRYRVADITDISKNGDCIVMNLAEGIQMNKLVEILKDYKSNPAEFATKYAEVIEKNPWLKNPEKVIKDLPTTLLKTFDEQFMFMKDGGMSLMHGDPHTGNFFITADKKGRLVPEFIDTGNCVARTGKQIKDDINFFTNYFVGNSEGVAKYFVEQCGYKGTDKTKVVKEIAKEIQENIFGKKQNITKFGDVQGNIQVILERHGLTLSTDNATAMKAQMQFFSAITEAGQLGGQSLNIATLLKDIPRASFEMIKSKTNPFSAIKDAVKFAYGHQQQAVGTAYQFTINDAERAVELIA